MKYSFFYRIVLLCTTFTFMLYAQAQKKFTLVIDPGHGGKDAGAIGNFSNEKDINLKVALAFGSLVESNCPDVKVIYTRKTDVFIPLDTRADIANHAKANLFISIHTNSLPNGRIAYGSETYTLGMHRAAANLEVAKRENNVITYENDYKTRYQGFDPNKPESYVIFEFMQDKFMKESVDLARCIQKHYAHNKRADRSVRQAGFLVLRKTSMPSVLTEVGFISTPSEESYLNSSEGINTLATSIYNGFIDYRRKLGVNGKHVELPPPVQPVPSAANDSEANAHQHQAEKEVLSADPSTKKKNAVSKQKQYNTQQKDNAKAAHPSNTKTLAVVHYRIQISTSPRRLKTTDARFRNLPDIQMYKDGDTYKYTSGSYRTFSEAKKALFKAQQLFKDAFIVKFNGNERIK